MSDRREGESRRGFVGGLTLLGTATLLGVRSPEAAEPPPETTTLKLGWSRGVCQAPQYVGEELLRAEGFADIQYVPKGGTVEQRLTALASGEAHIVATFIGPVLRRLDSGDPITLVGGLHAGCFELFGSHRVRTIRDLKGKAVAIPELRGPQHLFLASILTHVGVDAQKDIEWAVHPFAESSRLLAEGKIGAFLGFPPEPQELRARKLGHVMVNSALDRPWSQYFCCVFVGNTEFIRRNPVATKRALRAILKAAELCALDPERTARTLTEKGYTARHDYAAQAMRDIPYRRWRDYDPEDTVRFYALRLHEAGMIKSSPKKIIAQGTDWRFFNELRKELKG